MALDHVSSTELSDRSGSLDSSGATGGGSGDMDISTGLALDTNGLVYVFTARQKLNE